MSVLSAATAVLFGEEVTAKRSDFIFAKCKGMEKRQHIHTRKNIALVRRRNRVNWKYITGHRMQTQVLPATGIRSRKYFLIAIRECCMLLSLKIP